MKKKIFLIALCLCTTAMLSMTAFADEVDTENTTSITETDSETQESTGDTESNTTETTTDNTESSTPEETSDETGAGTEAGNSDGTGEDSQTGTSDEAGEGTPTETSDETGAGTETGTSSETGETSGEPQTTPIEGTPTEPTTNPTEEIPVVEVEEHIVSFLKNGGSGTVEKMTLLEGESVVIPECTLTKSGYTFVGWNTERNGTGTAYAEGDTVAFEDISQKLSLYAQWQVKANFSGADLVLGEDLTLRFYVTLEEEVDDVEVSFWRGNVKLAQRLDATAVSTDADGKTVYRFDCTQIMPQYMGDAISAHLYLEGSEGHISSVKCSVLSYCEQLMKEENNPSAELQAMIEGMLHYGAAAQVYQNYKVDTLVNAKVDSELKDLDAESIVSVRNIEVKNEELAKQNHFTMADLYFANQNKIKLSYVGTDCTLRVDEKVATVEATGVGNTYVYYTQGITPKEFASTIDAELYQGDALIQTLTYSVHSYMKQMLQESSTASVEVKNLLTALYHYGEAAKAYDKSVN